MEQSQSVLRLVGILDMNRLRVLIIAIALWLIFLLGLAHPGILDVDISPVVFALASIAALVIFLLPDLGTLHWSAIMVPVLLIYAGASALDLLGHHQVSPATVLIELAVLSITVYLARLTSVVVANLEQVIDSVVVGANATRILSTAEGEDATNGELFRARRFNRPVGFLLLKLSDVSVLQISGANLLNYQAALQRSFLRARVGQLVESMLYHTDPIAWYKDELVICLPETNAEEALQLARRIYDLIRLTINIRIPIGVANFPDDGLIYADLVMVASRKLSLFDDSPEHKQAGTEQKQAEPTTMGTQERPAPGDNGTSKATVRELTYANVNPLGVVSVPSKPAWGFLFDVGVNVLRPLDDFFQPHTSSLKSETPYYDPDFWVNRLPYQSANARQVYRRVKRLMDLAMAILVLPLALPLGAAIALVIFMGDGASPFYVQRRIGLGGRAFKMYKFRSMIPNADRRMEELGVRVNARGETVDENDNKLENDPRITRIGRILRKTSLDELPQIWNVLLGEMSVVGPRPTSFGVDKYSLLQTQRLSVKPGITGLWQVYDRGDTDFDKRLIWDIKYIDKMSLSLDLRVLIYTVLKFTHGAR
jgi:lipopolysaccharide/colanic/teichoic acid biosynthesis glycosyltransferase